LSHNKLYNIYPILKSKLTTVTHFTFEASTNRKLEGWEGKGSGIVTCTKVGEDILIFEELGVFETIHQKQLKCKNTYRWGFDGSNQKIALEHLRFGVDNPVFLFDLVQTDTNIWSSSCPHQCDLDEYHGHLILEQNNIKLDWIVKKGDEFNKMDYVYSSQ
jgi:hypothetical protein